MGRAIKKLVKLKEIVFKEEFYPRTMVNWQTAYDYSQSLKMGAKFPPIILALWNNQLILVDGAHRKRAYELNKLNKIPAIVNTGWSKIQIFKEAIKANISHGRVLSPYEKRSIALKLRQMKIKDKEISNLVQIPLDKLEKFVGQRLVNTFTGEEVSLDKTEEWGKQIVKSTLKHLTGGDFSKEEIETIENNQRMYSDSQIDLFKQIINLIENKMVSNDKDVQALYKKLRKLLS